MSFSAFFALCQVSSFLVLGTSSQWILPSPCPNLFRYEKMNSEGRKDWIFPLENNIWRGTITVPPSLPIYLKVQLLVPVPLPSRYVGRIQLDLDKDEIVKKINSGNLDKIKYFLYFPAKIPIPELMSLQVNSEILCSRIPVPIPVKTILTLEHSLLTLEDNASLRGGIGSNGKPQVFNIDVRKKSLNRLSCCGRSLLKSPLKWENSPISKGDWPWMVPLFKKTATGLEFLCGSTLVGYTHVVTAAHCVKFKNSDGLAEDDIVAYVGRFDIKNWTESDVQPREIAEKYIHADFDPTTLRSDLAILKFRTPVEPSPYVNPACLWQGNEDLNIIVGKKGIVFGWGMDGLGNRITATPNLAVMPIVSQEECLRSKTEFVFLTSDRTLCAGFRNGTGPCNGDSGGGLMMPRTNEDGSVSWVLRGVVSLSLPKNDRPICNLNEYSVFTDVAKYCDWIKEVISTDEYFRRQTQ